MSTVQPLVPSQHASTPEDNGPSRTVCRRTEVLDDVVALNTVFLVVVTLFLTNFDLDVLF